MPLGWGWGLRMSSPRRVLHAIDRLNRSGLPAVLTVHPWELDPDPPRVRLPARLQICPLLPPRPDSQTDCGRSSPAADSARSARSRRRPRHRCEDVGTLPFVATVYHEVTKSRRARGSIGSVNASCLRGFVMSKRRCATTADSHRAGAHRIVVFDVAARAGGRAAEPVRLRLRPPAPRLAIRDDRAGAALAVLDRAGVLPFPVAVQVEALDAEPDAALNRQLDTFAERRMPIWLSVPAPARIEDAEPWRASLSAAAGAARPRPRRFSRS